MRDTPVFRSALVEVRIPAFTSDRAAQTTGWLR
jgi:hypothetical protein